MESREPRARYSESPFRTAAEGLIKVLRSGECAKVEFAGPEDIDKLVTSVQKLQDELAKMSDASKSQLPNFCKRIAALGADEVRLRETWAGRTRGASRNATTHASCARSAA